MKSRGGYVKLFRSLASTSLWTKEPFTRGQAWVDLLMLANFKPGHLRVRGNRVEVDRGQIGWSSERLAIRWQWSRGKVNRFLKELENEQQIEQQKSFVTTVLTLTNYKRYQARSTASGAADGQQTDSTQTADGTADGHQNGALSKKGITKKVKNGKKDEEASAAPFAGMLPEVLDVEEFRAALGQWLAYKGNKYKPMGMTAMVSRAANLATKHGVRAVIDAMSRAMANTWAGWDQESSFSGVNHGSRRDNSTVSAGCGERSL